MEKINGIHIYQGNCPDENNGQYARDENCSACQALINAEKLDIIESIILDGYKERQCGACGDYKLFKYLDKISNVIKE